jgi:WD40 repeat protein
MPSSQSRKTKAAASLVPKQATLFSFWSKKPPTIVSSTKKQEGSDDSSSTPYCTTKRQRVQATVLDVEELESKRPLAITPEGNNEKLLAKAAAPHAVPSCNSNENQDTPMTDVSDNREVKTLSIVVSAETEGNRASTSEQANKDPENRQEKLTIGHSLNDYNDYSNHEGLSEYELLRLRNIARNNARLEALGLLPINQHSAATKLKTKRRPAKGLLKSEQMVSRPSRRSTRLSRPKMTCTDEFTTGIVEAERGEAQHVDIAIVEEQQSYEVSPVVQYEMEQQSKQQLSSTSDTQASYSINDTMPGAKQQTGSAMLVPTGRRLAPPQGLSAIYSLNFFADTQWIVGAGKSGIIALWNCDRTDRGNTPTHDSLYVDPVFSWKAHSGRWIAEAQFLPRSSATATPSRLVTAGNDGSVCLWDLRQVSGMTGIPKLLEQSGKSWHASGIFALDVAANNQGKIVTGSKDKSVAIGNVSDLGRPMPTWRSSIHSAKVGAVKFKDDHVLATASDDGSVAVLDDRMPDGSNPPVVLLDGLHQGRPHTVVWDKESCVLLTAGLDSVIQAWDMRYLKHGSPSLLHEYFGHVPTTTRGCKRIHHPVPYKSVCGGRFILTGGQGSHALSIFQVQPPVDTTRPPTVEACGVIRSPVYSRGSLPEDCSHSDIGSIAVQQDIVAATVEGEVLLLRPKSP